MSKYIHITDGNPKRKAASSTTKPRKPRRKITGTIEIVDTKALNAQADREANAQSPVADMSGENNKEGCIDDDLLDDRSTGAIDRLKGGLATTPGADIDYGQTLLSCSAVEVVRDWYRSEQIAFKSKVDRGYARRKLPDAIRGEANAILNGVGAVSAFTMSDDHLMLEAFDRLHRHLVSHVSADPNNEVALITFISGDGAISMDRPVIDVRKPRERVKAAMRKLAPHWVGLTDLALFNTIQHQDGGLVLSQHEHVIAWGKDFVDKAKRMAVHYSTKFPPNVTGCPVIKVVRATDNSEVNLARLAAYLLKAPAKAKNWFKRPDGSEIMNHTEAKDRYIQFLRVGELRSLLTFDEMIFGGNDGSTIKSSMVKEMHGLAVATARGRDARHPDTLSTFWAEFNKELGQDRWAVPAILRR